MAQAIYCASCRVYFTAELRGKSCPACGDELIHARVPAGARLGGLPKRPHASRAVWDHIIRRDPCAYCECLRGTTVDHVQPKALGGSKGSWTNRAGACFDCNQKKAHTPLLFFMLEQLGEDLSAYKDKDGNWPIPETPAQMAERVAREEAEARATPHLVTHEAEVIEPEAVVCALVA